MEKSATEILDILKYKIDEYISLNFFNEDKIATNVNFFYIIFHIFFIFIIKIREQINL
jgi:hypothetical protein